MRLKIAAAATVALVVAAGAALYYVAGTPHYSLYLLRNAIHEGDRATFNHHFDAKRVIENTVSRAVGGIRAGPGMLAKQATDLMLPAAERVLTERIEAKLNDPSSAPLLDMSIASVRYQGRAAYVTLRSDADGSTTTVVLERMRDRKWKVIDVDLAKANISFEIGDMT